jgi:hypothetical protein
LTLLASRPGSAGDLAELETISCGANEPLAIQQVRAPNRAVQYQKYEVVIDLTGAYANAFDPEELNIQAQVITPSGRGLVARGFFYQDFRRARSGETAGLPPLLRDTVPVGKPDFRVRLCPTEVGRHTWKLVVKDRNDRKEAGPFTFTCEKSTEPGFIRPSKANPLYFQFDNGQTYFPIGHNVCWSIAEKSVAEYDRFIPRMGAAGENCVRLWMASWHLFTIEHDAAYSSRVYTRLGQYDLRAAWRLDYVLDLCRQHGLHAVMTIDTQQAYLLNGGWNENPYNVARGGPCRQPRHFYESEAARKLFIRRLAYLSARWGHSPSVFAWDLVNEVDAPFASSRQAYNQIVPVLRDWHAVMARQLRRLDPHQHPIGTSFGYWNGAPDIDALSEMDYVRTHQYATIDAASLHARFCRAKAARYGKPHFFGEFGQEPGEQEQDVEGVNLRHGIWAPLFNLGAGTSMSWYWNYIDEHDLYRHYRPLAAFVRDIPLAAAHYQPVDALAAVPQPRETFDWVQIQPDGFWGSPKTPQRVEVRQQPWELPEGLAAYSYRVFEDPRLRKLTPDIPKNLAGTGDPNQNPVTFAVGSDKGGMLCVAAKSSPQEVKLVATVDGVAVAAASPVPWKKTSQMPVLYHLVPFGAGNHTIQVRADTKEAIVLTYVPYSVGLRTAAPLRVYAMSEPAAPHLVAFAWLQDRRDTILERVVRGHAPERINDAVLTLPGLRDGKYQVQWWDTTTGAVIAEQEARSTGGRLVAPAPAFERDLACKVLRKG